MTPPQDIGDQALIGAAGASGGGEKVATGDAICCGGTTGGYQSTNQVATNYVWGTSTALNSARGYTTGVGYKSSFIIAGGWDGSIVSNSAVFDGSAWATEVALNTERRDTSAMAGNVSEAVIALGRNAAGSLLNTTTTWNGTSWASSGTVTTNAVEHPQGDGNTSDMLYSGGYDTGPVDYTGLYDGTTWSTGVTANFASYGSSIAGANTSAMHQAGGNYASSQSFDGTSWTNETAYSESGDTTTVYVTGGGVADSHLIMGTNNTDTATGNWNGSSWETKGDMTVQIYGAGGDGSI